MAKTSAKNPAAVALGRLGVSRILRCGLGAPGPATRPRTRRERPGLPPGAWPALRLPTQPIRIIAYTDPATGQAYEFLTNEWICPPGVIAELYRRRWDVEKVFDEIKNKLGEKKAWGTSLTAKATQGQLVALTHNLLLIYEAGLEREHDVTNAAEDQRRQERHRELQQAARQAGGQLTTRRTGLRRATQRSVKFVRWLRQALREKLAEADAVPRLTQLYATL